MPFAQVASPDPRYLAATDILIGDMSDINYEFLLFDRPVILLANQWLRDNFPDIGIKTDPAGLEAAIRRSLDDPAEFHAQRQYWLEKTMYKPDGSSSRRCIDMMLGKSQIDNPKFVFIHGGDPVRKRNLEPMVQEAEKRGLETSFVVSVGKNGGQSDTIYVAAHVADLNITSGYKVHFDHGLKGKGTANVDAARKHYKEKGYFPLNDLHITAGEVGQERTQMLLGPYSERAVTAGYPKADDLLGLNTEDNRKEVCKELGFDPGKSLITYAPAGKEAYGKPGGSLSSKTLDILSEIASRQGYNILIKLKYPKGMIILQAINKLRRMLAI